jgi:hypothetical protein
MTEQLHKCAFGGLCMKDKFTLLHGMHHIKCLNFTLDFIVLLFKYQSCCLLLSPPKSTKIVGKHSWNYKLILPFKRSQGNMHDYRVGTKRIP